MIRKEFSQLLIKLFKVGIIYFVKNIDAIC